MTRLTLLMLGTAASVSAAPPEIMVRADEAPAFSAPRVPDGELAAMRGGFRTPGGFDLSFGFDIQTRVDGVLALHTVYASDGPAAGIHVYSDGSAPDQATPVMVTVKGSTPAVPRLTVDRSPAGTSIVPANATPAPNVTVASGAVSTWPAGTGEIAVPVTPNGPAVTTPSGSVSLQSTAQGTVVMLQGADLQVQQLIGRSTGVVVANSASDRVINTVSTVNVDLRGFTPGLATAAFQAERAALQAVLARGFAS